VVVVVVAELPLISQADARAGKSPFASLRVTLPKGRGGRLTLARRREGSRLLNGDDYSTDRMGRARVTKYQNNVTNKYTGRAMLPRVSRDLTAGRARARGIDPFFSRNNS